MLHGMLPFVIGMLNIGTLKNMAKRKKIPLPPRPSHSPGALPVAEGAGDRSLAGDSQPTSTPAADNDLNDLFGVPETAEAAQPPVAREPAPATQTFKSTRTWHDNTGLFQVDAKLVVIFSDSVRLLKENGKFCTLPIRRLSDSDKQFIEHVAQLLPGGDAKYVSAVK